jgi:Ca-activated chloride channel family protein
MVNFFRYDLPWPEVGGPPVAVDIEAAPAPWRPEHHLVRVSLQARDIPWSERPASNLVFLLDVSGSMGQPNKLPLVKNSLRQLVNRLDGRDRLAIVTYAGGSQVALPSTTANNRETIRHAIDALSAEGGTHGSAGIHEAYRLARRHFLDDANNRVILCTDGDFNIGTTNRSELIDLVQEKATEGVFLSVFGFGQDNLQDGMLEALAQHGQGNYGYIDSRREAQRLFVRGAPGTLLTVAKDVKLQLEFNPSQVQAYRLLGYANRLLEARDFNDDRKDAGELGAGHQVTALYEIIPPGIAWEQAKVDDLKYQKSSVSPASSSSTGNPEWLTVKLRWKGLADRGEDADPAGFSRTSQRREFAWSGDSGEGDHAPSENFRWSAAVGAFVLRLSNSDYLGETDWALIRSLAESALGQDSGGPRSEFLLLVDRAEEIWDRGTGPRASRLQPE